MLAVDMKEVKNSINLLCEYTDRELEAIYFARDIYGSKKYLKPVVLILGVLNSLFIIPDIIIVGSSGSIYAIAAARGIVLTAAILLLFFIDRIGSPYTISALISVSELLCFGTFMIIFWAYPKPDLLIQVLGLIVIILVVFIISNRWIYMLGISVTGAVCFFLVAAAKFADDPDWNAFSAGALYTALTIIFSAYSSYRMNYYGRVHYLLNQELEKMSVTDPLTGLMNKTKLYEELHMWMNFSRRYKTPLSLILFDVDDFKLINDKYGHMVGDEVMVKIVGIIRSMIRETDSFARWGGDEFTIIMPHTGRMQALEITERLRKEISETVFLPDFHVTCSFGVASLNNRVERIDHFICAADQALYKAKNSGKNIVMY